MKDNLILVIGMVIGFILGIIVERKIIKSGWRTPN